VARDGTGFFLHPTADFRGAVDARIRIKLDTAMLANKSFVLGNHLLEAFGIEMVYIPDGAFFVGDTDSLSIQASSFFKSDGKGRPGGLLEIKNENLALPIGKEKDAIFYRVTNKEYQGDQLGPVPAVYPKGYNGFYIMKYELLQSQYTSFLNSLPQMATTARSKIASKDYEKLRGAITLHGNVFISGSKNRPANFVSWDDGCAFADWAALRPMTDLEYIKACRGPALPVPRDYPWGTNSKDKMKRYVDTDHELKWADDLNESQLNDGNRVEFGASYYWVMDLAGSLWERVISIGAEKGRKFLGTHGDGNLSYGYATNSDWPSGDHNSEGYGFAGGGFYDHGLYTEFHVPHSPVSARNFGSWAGGYANQAYGQRFVRSADK
ncbi:MAG TPA: SUMF1/EgtB/PvdO family nonheme iron enzyme, partial [Cyclobacteriaceae bacterium]|nr:SUMF1/EgtB/PvdO family nonheme iron enzyme [Cyclobacteriaceae bacterium]